MNDKKSNKREIAAGLVFFSLLLFGFTGHELFRNSKAQKTVDTFITLVRSGELHAAYASMDESYRKKTSFDDFENSTVIRAITDGIPVVFTKARAPGKYRTARIRYDFEDQSGFIYYAYRGNLFFATVTGSFRIMDMAK